MKDGQTIGQWLKWDFEANGDLVINDKNGRTIYEEELYGDWEKCEYDSKGNRIYYEDESGEIVDNRPKPCEGKEIVIEGVKYKLVKV